MIDIEFFNLLAMGQPVPEGEQGSGMSQMFITLFLMMVIFWVLLIRPQRKRQKELETKVNALKSGDRVITAGGFHALVTNVKERTVILKIADNVKVELEKASVATILPKESVGKTKTGDEPAATS